MGLDSQLSLQQPLDVLLSGSFVDLFLKYPYAIWKKTSVYVSMCVCRCVPCVCLNMCECALLLRFIFLSYTIHYFHLWKNNWFSKDSGMVFGKVYFNISLDLSAWNALGVSFSKKKTKKKKTKTKSCFAFHFS